MSEEFSHGYALLIGVGESAYPRLSLPVTVKDTQAIYAALIDPELCGYAKDQIRVFNNKEATRDNILEGLKWLQESANNDKEATIFVYYSGHGWLNKADNSYYLLPHDVKPSQLTVSALSAEVFTEALRQILAERLLVVIDSCHAAGMATSKDPEEIIREVEKGDAELFDKFYDFKCISPSKGLVEQLKQGKGRVVFTSSRGEEESWIHPGGLYSIYTYHFLEALQGAANKSGDTEVKVSNLMNHLSKAVPETVQKLYGKAQTPNFDMATEDFVIAKLKGGKGFKGWQYEQSQAEKKILELASINVTIYNYYNYYPEETRTALVDTTEKTDNLPCPYRGLFSFRREDAEYFFGRDVFIEELYKATQTNNFIPVLGASGSGKSSVIFAGLVPRLLTVGNWLFTHFRPGKDPFHALAQALVPLYEANIDETDRIAQARKLAGYFQDNSVLLSDVFEQIQHNYPQYRTLLIADQFEEIYTLCRDEQIRRNFLDILLNTFHSFREKSSLSTVLVATMRADFLGNVLDYPPLAEVLRNDVKIRSMNWEELREIIEKPAQKLGVNFEAGLVERILRDVDKQPGNLPLLEFALTELWQKRQAKILTHNSYEEIGEVSGALTRYADDKFDKLNSEEKERVRRIFIQLVQPGEGTEDTRRVATKAELNESNWELVRKLADARLVVTSRAVIVGDMENNSEQETVEVVHEALVKNWGRLREWMEVDREFRSWQEQLRSAMRQWEAHGRDKDLLWRGAALAKAEKKLVERPEDLEVEKLFIWESVGERDRVQQSKAKGKQQVLKIVQQLKQAQAEVLEARETQQKQRQLNIASSLARNSMFLLSQGKDLDAFLEAIRSGKILQKYQAKDLLVLGALIDNFYKSRKPKRLQGHNRSVYSVSISNDSKIIVSGSEDKTIKVWNLETGAEIRTLTGHDDYVFSVSTSNDGKTIVSGSYDNTIKVWNLETGANVRTLTGHDCVVYSVSISNDGKTIVSGSHDSTIKIWNLETGAEIRTLTGHEHWINSVSISNDSKTIVSGSSDNKTIKVWDMETGKEIRTLRGHYGSVNSLSLSNDGKTIVSGSCDKTIKLWNLETGAEIGTLTGHNESITSVSLSNDGKTIVSGSFDNTIKVWNIDFDWLMERSCYWVRNYLQHNPNVTEDDRRLCDL